MLIPQSIANAAYYKMKLQVHNFTVYDSITYALVNYVWDKCEGNLVASTFSKIVIKHIKNLIGSNPNIHNFIIYSDECFYQNRNGVLSNAFIFYLIVGHTQMKCNSTHSIIQRKINNKRIHFSSQLH